MKYAMKNILHTLSRRCRVFISRTRSNCCCSLTRRSGKNARILNLCSEDIKNIAGYKNVNMPDVIIKFRIVTEFATLNVLSVSYKIYRYKLSFILYFIFLAPVNYHLQSKAE
jgi:hypothetical protein